MNNEIELKILLEVDTGSKIGQCRAVPVHLGSGAPKAFVVIYSAEGNIDPWEEAFIYPSDSLKIALITEKGEIQWKRDLGMGVVPGIWFCPVFVFDLDRDGIDEIWFLNNSAPQKPFARSKFVLERMDVATGKTTGQWKWPCSYEEQSMSASYRNFILGGYVNGEPVLVTAQGTYFYMYLQGWNADMTMRWEIAIDKDAPGARGSHMCPVVDINHDGIDEIMWGERCISIDTGKELFCADRDLYINHSDIIQPVMDWEKGCWYLYTCREDYLVSPRVVMFDHKGESVWGSVDYGHMHSGWVAHLGEGREQIALAVREGDMTPEGSRIWEEFVYKAFSGEPYKLPFKANGTIPVDINGDGYHELYTSNISNSEAGIIDRHGNIMGHVGGHVAMASKFMDHPGEQLLVYYNDGKLRVWADGNAKDTPEAMRRYEHPYYKKNQRLGAVGYNVKVLTGL